ncbi:MAG: ABC transporter ATP-binding protein [Kocuria sp.]|nr:ABC transporter ATP-binding protein [Kocuria sp.]
MSIRLHEVTRFYHTGGDHVTALEKLSLQIDPGTMVALMGPSGSGKSTVLNVCAGLDTPDSGEVVVLEKSVNSMSASARISFRRENIGVVFQDNNLIQEFNALENVMLPLLARGIRHSEATEIAIESLERLGVGALKKRFPHEMSGGQVQRVGISRAIAGGKKVLLTDEPTGSLDSHNTQEVFSALQELALDGATVLVATHDPSVHECAHNVLHLVDGRLAHDLRNPHA